jgi:hypothetical protein
MKMKKTIFILAITIPLAAGIIFAGNRSSANKLKDAQTKILISDRDVNSKQNVANTGAGKPVIPEEWITFKNESELKISNHEIRIAELNREIKNQGESSNAKYKKKIAYLDQQNKFMKARLESYEKGPSNWESFKQGFNYDMEAIGKALKDFTVDNKK